MIYVYIFLYCARNTLTCYLTHINQFSFIYVIFVADQVVMISVAFLVILFSVQKYGTSKVGLALGPALFIWFCSLGVIGIYNLVKYDSSVLRAFNPVHIYYFFKRNSTKGWYALGGCLLCATGKEGFQDFQTFGFWWVDQKTGAQKKKKRKVEQF